MKTLSLSIFCALVSVVSTEAANIIWVSFHPDDNSPSAAAATAGFTNAPDIGYTQLLRANGHTVTRVVTSATPDTNQLNSADLVIISRSVPSGNYQTAPAPATWNGITAPTIILGGYIIRQNRLGYMAGSTIPDTAGPVKLRALLPNHPIFQGVSLDAGGTMVNPYAHLATYTNNPQRGISVVTGATAGGGVMLATIGTSGDPAAGGMVIGEWLAGSKMSDASADTLGGHRLVLLTGSREASSPTGLTSEGAGIYDLDPDGAQLLLNAVDYMTSGRTAIKQVTTANSTGAGSLSEALTGLQDGDTVTFNIPNTATNKHYIVTPPIIPGNGYPLITANNITIDGFSQPGSLPNTNPILATNNASYGIVLDSRDGGATSNESPGFDATETGVLFLMGTNCHINGLCILGPGQGYLDGNAHYGICVGNTADNTQVSGCWIGVDLDGSSIYPFDNGVAQFGDNTAGATRFPKGTIVGVKAGAADTASARAQFNVFCGSYIDVNMQGQDLRISGNFINVLPDGLHDLDNTTYPLEALIEMGRGGNNLVIGTDGDGLNDAEERNVFGGVTEAGDDNIIELYGGGNDPTAARTNMIVAGNYIGVAVDGVSRFTNSMNIFDSFGSGTAQFGSDFDGVSDDIEANLIFMNYPPLDPNTATVPVFCGRDPGGTLSLRGNKMVNNNLAPFSYADGLQGRLDSFTNYEAPHMDTSVDIIPILDSTSTSSHLKGTFATGLAPYTNVIIDIYQLDPEGWNNGKAIAGARVWPELTDGSTYTNGFPQGLKYLGSSTVANIGSFDIDASGFDLTSPVTVTANYSADPPGTHRARTHTSNFSNPVTIEVEPSLSISLSGTDATISWPAAATGFTLESTDSLSAPNWTAVGGVANNSVTVNAGTGNKFYRLRK